MDYETILFDRLEIIKLTNKQYDLEKYGYVSFSGGGDSTMLHYLVDLALPNNKIPRVFINTGIEYNDIVEYVKEMQKQDDRIIINISGDGFLYNMVRIIVGTLLDVGTGKIKPEEIPEIIKSKQREKAGKTVPAQGLYLVEVKY